MKGWLRDIVSAFHWGVPHEDGTWKQMKVVEDRMTRVEEDVEALKVTVSAITWKWDRDDATRTHKHS